jgi:hypothetical protein
MATYQEQLQDPRWQARRDHILTRDNWECQNPRCPGTSNHLHVHHRWYGRGRMPWQYPDEALITLCDVCHHAEHFRPSTWLDVVLGVVRWLLLIVLSIAVPILNVLFALAGLILILGSLVLGFGLHLRGFQPWPMLVWGVGLLVVKELLWLLLDRLQTLTTS